MQIIFRETGVLMQVIGIGYRAVILKKLKLVRHVYVLLEMAKRLIQTVLILSIIYIIYVMHKLFSIK
jgi:hypothetical protein